MKLIIFLVFIALEQTAGQQVNGYWSAEFDSASDLNLFNQETGAHGWGNNEKQDYTTQNAIISGGELNIWTHKTFGGGQTGGYTSSRLLSKNSFRYGTFEMRARIPKGRGVWPAFWLLSAKRPLNWPLDGEIDILEHVGHDYGTVHGTIHTGKYNHGIGTQKGAQIYIPDVAETFHVYKFVWTPTRLSWYVDDRYYFEYVKEANAGFDSWPFDTYYNIIVNTAVGGWWGGAQGIDDSVFPQKYSVDYIRYYPYAGPVVEPPVVEPPFSISWNTDASTGMKWALGCDFYGNDLSSAVVPGEQCATKCKVTPGCTHFSWNNYNGGTCWMKKGSVVPGNAQTTNDKANTCGYKY